MKSISGSSGWRTGTASLAARLGFDRVVRLRQVHGDTVVHADDVGTPWPDADAMWTATSGLLLGVAAADCVPILIAVAGVVFTVDAVALFYLPRMIGFSGVAARNALLAWLGVLALAATLAVG